LDRQGLFFNMSQFDNLDIAKISGTLRSAGVNGDDAHTSARPIYTAAQMQSKMASPIGVNEALDLGFYEDASNKVSPQALNAVRESMNKNNENIPMIVLDNSKDKNLFGEDNPAYASAFRTSDNTPYITVNSAFLKESPDTQDVLLRHESAHLRLDTSAQALADINSSSNKKEILNFVESRADMVAVCESPNPTEAARTLSDHISRVDAIEKQGELHPNANIRIQNIMDYPPHCSELLPSPVTPKMNSSQPSSGRII
jgi:hypothetical protein